MTKTVASFILIDVGGAVHVGAGESKLWDEVNVIDEPVCEHGRDYIIYGMANRGRLATIPIELLSSRARASGERRR